MTAQLVIVGAGGHGREVLDIVEAINLVSATYDFVGFVDDAVLGSAEVKRRGTQVLGTVGKVKGMDALYLLGIGSGEDRRRIDAELQRLGARAAMAIHPTATIGGDVVLGEGAVLAAGARVSTNVRAGRHVHINLNATLSHDCRLGDFVTILPGAAVSGGVTIGDGVTIGASATVLPGTSIGVQAIVGAGAVVREDVLAGQIVVGVPARPLTR